MDKNIKSPKVTVMMPVHNAEHFIADSIRSVLDQTFRDFELLIIDDGSTDRSAEIAKSFRDERIRIVTNRTKTGLGNVRNQSIAVARGEYVAWLDADDIASRQRLMCQSSFLDAHKDVALVGSLVEVIDSKGHKTGVAWKEAIPEAKIPPTLLFHNCFTQSSVMLRKKALPTNPYRDEFAPAEDYELWVRIAQNSKIYNLPKILTQYRQHDQGASKVNQDRREAAVNKIITEQLKKFDIIPTVAELSIHRTNYGYGGSDVESFLQSREVWLSRLIAANKIKRIYDEELFESVIADRWLQSCYANAGTGSKIWRRCFASPLVEKVLWRDNWKTMLKFAARSI